MRVASAHSDRRVVSLPWPKAEEPSSNNSHIVQAGSSASADLANWLLMKEIGPVADAADVFEAGEQVCQKLSLRLARRVSTDGAQAILSRTLHLARAESPFLTGVRAGRAPDVCLEGVNLEGVDVGEVRQGVLAIVCRLLDLLVGLIGEELTLRMVREVWADLPWRQSAQAGESDGQEAAS
jgi:hypothetical protein